MNADKLLGVDSDGQDVVEVARMLGFDLAEWNQPEGGRTTNRDCIWLATTQDGEQIVVKWSKVPDWGEHLPETVRISDELLARGYPCPRTLAHGAVGEFGYATVQQRLNGAPCTEGLTPQLLDQVLDAIELQANPIQEKRTSEWSWVQAAVYEDHAKWWEQARALDAESAELCAQLEAWLKTVPRPELRDDYVHLDLNFSNILATGDALTGIVDLDHLGTGDRVVDIAGLAFEFQKWSFETGVAAPAEVIDRLTDAALKVSGESGWRQAVTYKAIAALGWSNPEGFRSSVDEAKHVVRRMIER